MSVQEKLTAIADAIREKTGTAAAMTLEQMAEQIGTISVGADLPAVEQATPTIAVSAGGLITATAEQEAGRVAAGTKTADKQLPTQGAKTITPSDAEQTAVESGVFTTGAVKVAAMPTATQATPSIGVSTGGLITASATQSAGYVAAGTKSATKQLTVQAAQTITPGTANKTIASGRYLTGVQTIRGDSNLKAENIVSGVSIFGVTGTAQAGESSDGALDSLIDGSITHVTSSVKTVRSYAFRGCGLISINLPEATEIETYAFNNCMELTTCTAPKITTLGSSAFYSCLKLKEIVMPKLTKTTSNCFGNCTGMVKADFTALTTIASGTFTNAIDLEALILRRTSVVSLASTGAFSNSAIAGGTGYVYVPASLVDSYKAATNWSTYGAQIRAIEDYPDVTGG